MTHTDPQFARWAQDRSARWTPAKGANSEGRRRRAGLPVDGPVVLSLIERSERDRVPVASERADARHLDAHVIALGAQGGVDKPLLIADNDSLPCGYFRHRRPPPAIGHSPNGATRDQIVEQPVGLMPSLKRSKQQGTVQEAVVHFA